MSQTPVTPQSVRAFLLTRYAERIAGAGRQSSEVADDFDLLMSGVIDSLGILEMVGMLEKEFGVELDFSSLEAEKMTVVGPLTQFVAEQVSERRMRSLPG